jgi:hypothetical protein
MLADIGVGFHVIAVILAAAAVIPMLGRTRIHRAERTQHAIYFGHLRHWTPEQLKPWLVHMTPEQELEQLNRQLIALSRRNWRKHRNLQLAMVAALLGAATIGIAVLLPH